MRHKKQKTLNLNIRRSMLLAFVLLLTCFTFVFNPKNSYAQCPCRPDTDTCGVCQCVRDYHGNPDPFAAGTLRRFIFDQHEATQEEFGFAQPITPLPWFRGAPYPLGTGRLGQHQRWIMDNIFIGSANQGGILPALMMMTEQFVTVMMHQMLVVGSFFDAKNQLETQLLFQDLMAQAHKDYHPSHGMCVFGTNTRSIGSASYNANLTSYVLGQRALERQLGSINVNASEGPKEDRGGRLHQVEERFCDRNDNNRVTGVSTGLGLICTNARPPSEFVNKDIDYTRTVDMPRTLTIDFSDGNLTPDEEDVMALASNLFSHHVFERVRESLLGIKENETLYLDLRSVVAKRAVAENSFNNIVALKTQGMPNPHPDGSPANANNTAEYMTILLQELGIPDDEIPMYLGDLADTAEIRPSYLSQLEILAKRIYQNPSFYVDLYDKPANVTRKKTAMRAINSIVQREIYDSQLRSESIMSVILELEIAKAQRGVQNKLMNLPIQSPGGP